MNTQFLITSCDINTICIYVTLIVLGYSVLNVFRSIAISWLEHRNSKKNDGNSSQVTSEDIIYKHEMERLDRVRALMKEIVSLTSDKIIYDETKEKKVYYEKYNEKEANNLFKLYQELDKYIKIKETGDGKKQQP